MLIRHRCRLNRASEVANSTTPKARFVRPSERSDQATVVGRWVEGVERVLGGSRERPVRAGAIRRIVFLFVGDFVAYGWRASTVKTTVQPRKNRPGEIPVWLRLRVMKGALRESTDIGRPALSPEAVRTRFWVLVVLVETVDPVDTSAGPKMSRIFKMAVNVWLNATSVSLCLHWKDVIEAFSGTRTGATKSPVKGLDPAVNRRDPSSIEKVSPLTFD